MKEALAVMIIGLAICFVASNMTLLGIGLFMVNFGFRGHANAVVNGMIEVTSDLWRQICPISLSLGWALGQVMVGILGIYGVGWRIIVLFTLLPLAFLWVLTLKLV